MIHVIVSFGFFLSDFEIYEKELWAVVRYCQVQLWNKMAYQSSKGFESNEIEKNIEMVNC